MATVNLCNACLISGVCWGKPSWEGRGGMMDPVPLDDASGIGWASMDNCRPWMIMIRTAECKKWLSLCVKIWEEDEEIKIYISKVSPSKLSLEWGYFILVTISLLWHHISYPGDQSKQSWKLEKQHYNVSCDGALLKSTDSSQPLRVASPQWIYSQSSQL